MARAMNQGVSRRRMLAVLSAAASTACVPGAFAQGPGAYPARPITLWVPWPAGGATDITLRLLAEIAGRHLGQRIVVDNRSGGGGTLVMPILQQAEPDGYTIAQLPQPIFRAPYTQKVLWDPIRDVTPIIQLTGVTFGVLVAANSPFRTLDDLFVYARAHPGELSIGTNGIGTTPHVVLEELFAARGMSYIHVPYKGTSEQMIAVNSGQVMVGVNSTGFGPFVDNGRLRLLATFGAQRTKRWPQVPTLRDLGFDIVAMSPFGLGGPRGLSANVVTLLHDAFKTALFDPSVVQELAKYDQDPAYLGPADYAQACREAYAKERGIVDRMGLARPAGG